MRAGTLGLALLAVSLAGLIGVQLNGLSSHGESPAANGAATVPEVAAPVLAAPASDVAQWAEASLARPLFSPERRPPMADVVAAAAPAPLPRLTGILISPRGRSAIFAGGARPMVVGEGGLVGGFTVRSIEPGQVLLAGPEGLRVVRPSFDAGRPATVPRSAAPVAQAPAAPAGPSLNLPDKPEETMPFDQNPAPSGLDILRNLGRTPADPAFAR